MASKHFKLFIGGLPGSVTNEELAAALALGDSVQIDIKRRKSDSSSLGYAFLLFDDPVKAQNLIDRPVRVRDRYLYLQPCRGQEQSANTGRLFIRGIPAHASDQELTEFFKELASCKCAYAIRDENGLHKGFGFLELWNESEVQHLVEQKTLSFLGHQIQLEEFRKRGKPQAKFSPNQLYSASKKKSFSHTSFADKQNRVVETLHDAVITYRSEPGQESARTTPEDVSFALENRTPFESHHGTEDVVRPIIHPVGNVRFNISCKPRRPL